MEPDLFIGRGIRTLSTENPFYNPFSYQRGSVWPVENGTIAFGLARYGCWEELHRLAEGIFASTELFAGNRLPEALSGMPRDESHGHPGIYPDSNMPQGWSASMIVVTIQALLGLRPAAPFGLLLVDPHLPRWLPWLRIDGVRIGRSVVDLEFERIADGTTRYNFTRHEGRVRVLRKPVPQGRSRSAISQAAAILSSLPRS
jgi:glycogen debranching enzyme